MPERDKSPLYFISLSEPSQAQGVSPKSFCAAVLIEPGGEIPTTEHLLIHRE